MQPKLSKAAAMKTITYTPERLERVWEMFTKSGKPVFRYGHKGFTLEQGSGAFKRQQVRRYADTPAAVWKHGLEKAKQSFGEECEWREGEPVRTFDVVF